MKLCFWCENVNILPFICDIVIGYHLMMKTKSVNQKGFTSLLFVLLLFNSQ